MSIEDKFFEAISEGKTSTVRKALTAYPQYVGPLAGFELDRNATTTPLTSGAVIA
jgi:hypothetical protein